MKRIEVVEVRRLDACECWTSCSQNCDSLERDTSLEGEIPYEGEGLADLWSESCRASEEHEVCFEGFECVEGLSSAQHPSDGVVVSRHDFLRPCLIVMTADFFERRYVYEVFYLNCFLAVFEKNMNLLLRY